MIFKILKGKDLSAQNRLNALALELGEDPNYVDIPEAASPTPLIFLLDVKLTSNTMGTIRKPVLYFMFENINFLDQILLKNKIRISHLVKVREGCGFGGNRKSISIVIDNRAQTDYRLIGILINKYKASPNAYELSLEAVIPRWSGLNVKVFSVNPIERLMHLSQLDYALSLIQRE